MISLSTLAHRCASRTTSAALAYTALSRARNDTRIYLVADDFDNDPTIDVSHAARQRAAADPIARLDRMINRSKANHLALDHTIGRRT